MKLSKEHGYITNLTFEQSEVEKARLLHGSCKTVKQWAKDLGADIVVNASLFNWQTGIPIETFKSEGKTYGVSSWVPHGFGVCDDLKTLLFADFNEVFYDYTCGFPTLIWECERQDTVLYTTVQGTAPRTIFSKGEAGFCITAIDGRRTDKPGMSLDQAAEYLMKKGMWYSCNLDGGDSTCLVVNGEVVNSPSGTRAVPCVLAVWLKKPEGDEDMVKTYSLKTDGNKSLSANFKVKEFRCRDGSDTILIDDGLVDLLQKIRTHFGKPVTISSAYRNATYNKKIGGASGSLHVKGRAADIVVSDVAPAEVAKYAERIGVKGIGLYETRKDGHFVHVDTRETKAFWYGQAQAYRETFGGAMTEYEQIADELAKHIDLSDKQGLIDEMEQNPGGRLYWICKKCLDVMRGCS